MSAVTDLLKVPSKPIKQKIRLKVGRKSAYTKEIAERFCAKIASGHSMSDICGKDGMPTSRQVFDWIHKYPEFGASYDRATVERGMHFGHKLTDLAAAVLAGEVDPQAARVAGDFYKFTAARLASKTWGEKSQVTVEHSVSAQAAQVLQELAQRGKQRQIEAQCIDVTPVPSLGEGDVADRNALTSLTIDGSDTETARVVHEIGAVDEAGVEPPTPATTPAPGCSSSTPAPRKRPKK